MSKENIEELLHISLTPIQKKYHNAFKWLVGKNTPITMATGRSFLLAVVFIEDALEHRGQWVTPFDNVPNHLILRDELMKTIYRLILNNGRLSELVVCANNKFKFLYGEI
jgi:hypothetical protein